MITPATKKSEIKARLIDMLERQEVLDELGLRREIREIKAISDVAEHAALKALAYAAADQAQLAIEQFEEAKKWRSSHNYMNYMAFLSRRSMMMEAYQQALEAYKLFGREGGVTLLKSIINVSFFAADLDLLINSTNDLIAMKPDMHQQLSEEAAFAVATFEGFKEATGTTPEQLTTLLQHAYALLTKKNKRVVGIRSFYHHEEGPSTIILDIGQVTPQEVAELNFDLAYYLVDHDVEPLHNVVINYQMARSEHVLERMELNG